MRRPLIGLTAYAQQATYGAHDQMVGMLPMSYVKAVHASGGRAVLITPDDPGIDVLESLDGIVFAGGGDVDPANWGAAPHPATESDPVRDASELMLMRAALDADLPVLGVCRGLQVMAVATGGSLHQHLPDLVGHERHRAAPGTDPLAAGSSDFGRHDVVLRPGSAARALLGARLTVNSFHHQAVDDPGGFTVVGRCPEDRVVEIIEHRDRYFALGVQWHPERTADLRVFAALVDAAADRSGLGETAIAA
ncbi:gamma-glutamyl-gamma-aminobutyrate hydrolase family protein [Amorphoplanes digitatis]|uniref:Putative glutamine amidotransferase n=1 Tax=Actinoplanes digitatis TaxID=1868 RepID=A0A7W7HTB9_9ACTN|nr:gamma-glutamyl-gamma-aminobutyrate hydrolase family protein [Actinoplanes digitatis]MBB4760412.1 putative glutamine amidotransferase [Actinoplanes digitatis]BFE68547.1 gamma-glutamyl-gamma-aminobutyrate hydrolase [Actinoplanes digitatis]GID95370.1 gamma-glutamyl-gamma-aminobutyrate hydrolase [Actinoplanes digitatis]